MISPNIKANSAEPGTFGIPCNQVSSLPAVISFTFTSQSGQPFDLTIPSSELSVGPFKSNPSLCQTLINADDSFNIIGASLLKHYYSVWDIGNQRMGFAPTGKVYAILPRFHFLLTDCYRNRILKLYLVTIYDVLTSNEKNIRTRCVLRFY